MGAVYNRFGGGDAKLKTKSITTNGTYYASAENVDGFSKVKVNVKSARNLLWSGEASDVTIDLSAYSFVYIETNGGSDLLLQVNGATGYAGLINTHSGQTFGTARGYKATSSGVFAQTVNYSATEQNSETINIINIYGITNII